MGIQDDHLLGENIGLRAAIKACLSLLPPDAIQEAQRGAEKLLLPQLAPDDADVDHFKVRESAEKIIATVFTSGR